MPFFKHIAVASTFSPQFEALLAEASRVARHCEGTLTALHVGEDTPETRTRFLDTFAKLGIEPAPALLIRPGDPAETILQLLDENPFDLLIAGALHKDLVRHFLGDVARALIRQARCSLLLFTKPVLDPIPFSKLVCVTDFSPVSREALAQTLFFAAECAEPDISVVRVFTVLNQAMARSGAPSPKDRSVLDEEQARLDAWATPAAQEVPIFTKVIQGTTGFAASDYVQATGAHLLIIPAGPPDTPHPFPRGMEWAIDVIPSNLLVVRAAPAARS